jgi:CspA family cold shock protein
MMQTGTMKWLNDAKGLGCIAPDGGREDLFAHLFEDRGSGYKSPQITKK